MTRSTRGLSATAELLVVNCAVKLMTENAANTRRVERIDDVLTF